MADRSPKRKQIPTFGMENVNFWSTIINKKKGKKNNWFLASFWKLERISQVFSEKLIKFTSYRCRQIKFYLYLVLDNRLTYFYDSSLYLYPCYFYIAVTKISFYRYLVENAIKKKNKTTASNLLQQTTTMAMGASQGSSLKVIQGNGSQTNTLQVLWGGQSMLPRPKSSGI